MPPIVTSLPWLSNQPDPVATYQRSQALVQQMQAQQAQERQQQAELAQRAQEAAMQAQFQQRALALKEQEARSAVQVEADRLRQKGQALEFEQRMAEQQSQMLAQPPEVVQLPGMPPGIMHGGRFYPGQRTPDISGVGRAVPVHENNDPTQPVIGHVAMTSERGGAFTRAVRPGETPEEKALAGETKEARSTDRRVLMDDRAALNKIRNSLSWEDRAPEEKATVLSNLSQIQKQLDAYRTVPVRVRRKSDGKILRYQGNKADVPTDQFEIVD